jgi:hypothetical protein
VFGGKTETGFVSFISCLHVNGYFLASRRCFIDIRLHRFGIGKFERRKNVNKNYTEESIRGGKLTPLLHMETIFSGMESEILH